MITGLFELILGPFLLFGILIVGFTVMTGGRADRVFGGYIRLCGQLFSVILMPLVARLPLLITWLGHHIEYAIDAQVKGLMDPRAFDGGRRPGIRPTEIIPVTVKDVTNEDRPSDDEAKPRSPYDDQPDIEAVEV